MRSLAETGREELADQIGGLGRALRTSGETLRGEEQGQAGYYSELLADQADRVSRFLREHDSSALIGQVEGFARRQPALFLGGCLVAGLALGRFLKASPPSEEPMPLGITGGVPPRYEPAGAGAYGTEPLRGPSVGEPVVTTETVSIGPPEPLTTPITPLKGPNNEPGGR